MKYLNAVLTVIAVCLVFITFAVTGIIPAANAKETPSRFVSVPVNPDGSINVKLVKGEVMDVNIEEINDSGIWGTKLPISSDDALDVNIEEVNGRNVTYNPLPAVQK